MVIMLAALYAILFVAYDITWSGLCSCLDVDEDEAVRLWCRWEHWPKGSNRCCPLGNLNSFYWFDYYNHLLFCDHPHQQSNQ